MKLTHAVIAATVFLSFGAEVRAQGAGEEETPVDEPVDKPIPSLPEIDASVLALSWQVEGQSPELWLGRAASFAGDVNGDGFDDVILGAEDADTALEDAGRAFLYHGSASGLSSLPPWESDGGQEFAYYGASVAGAGDVNGDGYDDVIVGAYGGGTDYEGEARIYYGSSSGLSPAFGWRAFGGQTYALMGYSVAGAGDVNGDGFADVLVGALAYTSQYMAEGRVFVFYGSAAGPSAQPDWTADGGRMVAHLGASVAAAGDVNGDGFGDVILGADLHTGAATNEGRALVYLGSPQGLEISPVWTATGGKAYAYFGSSVAGVGDVDGDGYGDIAVGAWGYSDTSKNEGAAYLFRGSAGGPLGLPEWSAVGGQSGARFGERVAAAGDVNKDGLNDVAVGCPAFNWAAGAAGAVFVYFGNPDGRFGRSGWLAFGDTDFDRFGSAVAGSGDVDGDGGVELLIGVPNYSNGESFEGMARLYSSSGAMIEEAAEGSAAADDAPSSTSAAARRSGGSQCFSMSSSGFGSPWLALLALAVALIAIKR